MFEVVNLLGNDQLAVTWITYLPAHLKKGVQFLWITWKLRWIGKNGRLILGVGDKSRSMNKSGIAKWKEWWKIEGGDGGIGWSPFVIRHQLISTPTTPKLKNALQNSKACFTTVLHSNPQKWQMFAHLPGAEVHTWQNTKAENCLRK